jgi:hypothetical protein
MYLVSAAANFTPEVRRTTGGGVGSVVFSFESTANASSDPDSDGSEEAVLLSAALASFGTSASYSAAAEE